MPNIIDIIEEKQKPGDLANWWGKQNPRNWTHSLDAEEVNYMEVFTSPEIPAPLRIGRGIATVSNLAPEQRKRAKQLFGDSPDALALFVNYENRRRIIAHYVYTHPATIQYELQLYRTTRDLIPPLFIVERVYELFTGEEYGTGDEISRLRAGVDLLIPMIIGRVLRMARSGVAPPARPYTRPLKEPIYDLPAEGGGLTINGRWYTEHALERMAPDTPRVRAELRTRAAARLERLGIRPGSAAWDACMQRALQKIDPRGVPPSVVEAEITKPGSTNVRVITARRGQVVVTVIVR